MAGSETGADRILSQAQGLATGGEGSPARACPCGSAMVIAEPAPCPTALASALEEQRNGEWRYLKFLQVCVTNAEGGWM